MPVSLIAAVSANGVIGRNGALPWHLPADLRRFKQLTMGHHLLVGRRTWESIGRPLPGRKFILVTRHPESGAADGVAGSVAEAIRLALATGDAEPFVAGGEGVFREALEQDLVDRLYLTEIHGDYEGEARFPAFDRTAWREVARDALPAEPGSGQPGMDFVVLGRARRPASMT